MKVTLSLLAFAFVFFVFPNQASAEFRAAKDMQKECSIALAVLEGTADKSTANALLVGECIGYVQGATDAALAMAQNVSWYKVCMPDNISTESLIHRFIAFVEENPKYTLASTAIEMMLGQAFPCRK